MKKINLGDKVTFGELLQNHRYSDRVFTRVVRSLHGSEQFPLSHVGVTLQGKRQLIHVNQISEVISK